MRFVIFAAIVCFCVVGALADNDAFQESLNRCTKKLNADPEAVKAALEEGKTDNADVKCVLACSLQEEGSMNEAGEVDKANMLKEWPASVPVEQKEKIVNAIHKCADERGNDKCETAYAIFECVEIEMDPKEE